MTSSYQSIIDRQLPLRVLEVEWSDPTLALVGVDWALSITCPWKVENSGKRLFDWTALDVEDRVWDFIGRDVCVARIDESGDLQLGFSDGSWLYVSSDVTYDTWTFRLREVTLVGPLLED